MTKIKFNVKYEPEVTSVSNEFFDWSLNWKILSTEKVFSINVVACSSHRLKSVSESFSSCCTDPKPFKCSFQKDQNRKYDNKTLIWTTRLLQITQFKSHEDKMNIFQFPQDSFPPFSYHIVIILFYVLYSKKQHTTNLKLPKLIETTCPLSFWPITFPWELWRLCANWKGHHRTK